VAERARNGNGRSVFPRARTFGTTAVTAGQQFSWIWSRESLLRLLLSLVLSLALWLYVTNRENPRIVQDFPQPLLISPSTPPPGTTLTSNTLGSVYVRIRRTDLNTPVTSSSFRVFVDLSNLKVGRHMVPVQVISDPGIDVVSKSPAAVPIVLERKLSRRVPVNVSVQAKPPAGYGWSFNYKPQSVTVSGPADIVSQVKQATVYVGMHNLTSSISRDYAATPVNDAGSEVTGAQLAVSPARVHVTTSIHPYSSYKTVPVLVQFSGLPKQGYGVAGVRVNPEEIAASGSPSALKSVSTVHTWPISVHKRGGGSFTKKVQIQLPKGVHTNTRYVSVVVEIAPVQSSTSVEIGIQLKGVASGLVAHTNPGRLLTTITGPSNALHGIANSTHATVNLTGYGPGVYQLHPVVKSRHKGVSVEAVYPQLVTVQLRSSG
jgi:YbbR domain-containing protein